MHLLFPALTCMAFLKTTAPGMRLWEAHHGRGAPFSLPMCQKHQDEEKQINFKVIKNQASNSIWDSSNIHLRPECGMLKAIKVFKQATRLANSHGTSPLWAGRAAAWFAALGPHQHHCGAAPSSRIQRPKQPPACPGIPPQSSSTRALWRIKTNQSKHCWQSRWGIAALRWWWQLRRKHCVMWWMQSNPGTRSPPKDCEAGLIQTLCLEDVQECQPVIYGANLLTQQGAAGKLQTNSNTLQALLSRQRFAWLLSLAEPTNPKQGRITLLVNQYCTHLKQITYHSVFGCSPGEYGPIWL